MRVQVTPEMLGLSMCARCRTWVAIPQGRETCGECHLEVGPRPQGSIMVCDDCGDRWALPQAKVCAPCLPETDTENLLPA